MGLKGKELKVGDRFVLSGQACNPAEANERRVFKVVEVEAQEGTAFFTKVLCEIEGHSGLHPVVIAPWVPIVRI